MKVLVYPMNNPMAQVYKEKMLQHEIEDSDEFG